MRERGTAWVRWRRVVVVLPALLSVVLAAALAVSWWSPASFNGGRLSVGITRGYLEVATSTVRVNRQPNVWVLSAPQVKAGIVVGPTSWWRPTSMSAAAMIMTGGVTTSYPLTVWFVPLWPWVVGAAGLAIGCWWRWWWVAGPGQCRRCGYDVGALKRCPECGLEGDAGVAAGPAQ